MKNRDVALTFVSRFCAADVDALSELLADDFRLKGPLGGFESKATYVSALQENPPVVGRHRILSVSEGVQSVSIFYEYERNETPVTIAQLFLFDSGRISEILLVFDTADLLRD